jgi:hypothetical protein
MVELYLRSPVHIHGVLLNELSTGRTLPLPYFIYVSTISLRSSTTSFKGSNLLLCIFYNVASCLYILTIECCIPSPQV